MGTRYCNSPDGWGPTRNQAADLTLCFSDSILVGLPALLAILAFCGRLVHLVQTRKAHGLGRTWAIYGTTQGLVLTACGVLLARVVLVTRHGRGYSISTLFATVAMLCAWILAMVLNHAETKYEIRSSSFIFIYYLVTITGASIQTRTMVLLGQSHDAQFYAHVAFLAIISASFVVEALPRGRTTVQIQSGASDYDKANIFSRLSFHYFQPIVSKAYHRDISQDDVDGMAPAELHTAHIYPRLSRGWQAQVAKETRQQTPPPSLLRFLLASFGFRWAQAVALRHVLVALTFVSPQLLSLLLGFIQSYGGEGQGQPLALGIILAFGMFFASMMVVVVQSAFVLLTVNMGSEIRTGLIAMMYRKSLRLSAVAKQKLGAGKITNHISVDAETWPRSASVIAMVSSLPLEISLAIWLLYRQLGWCVFVGLGTIIAMIPLQGYLAKRFQMASIQKMEVTDTRIRVMNEVLSNIKTVKLYAWEAAFQTRLFEIRQAEIKALRKLGINFSFMSIIFSGLSMMVSLFTFVVYALVGGPNFSHGNMSPQVVFVSLTLFGLLSNPITTLGQIMSELVELRVATKRIEAFLLAEEIDDSNVERLDHPSTHDPLFIVVQIQDGVFAWAKEPSEDQPSNKKNIKSKPHGPPATEESSGTFSQPPAVPAVDTATVDSSPTLKNIQLSLRMGSLTAVVGRIGMGKSSLLAALIGDMWKCQGTVKVSGRVAYVPQQAWIVNATVRDNIVFGMPFDQAKYDRILHAAGLSTDLEMLPAGDQTEIGERGINLSGGQKQRVSLARAAYQEADVYLLDDPLSAVDAHVDQHLWEHLIGPSGLLKNKTRLLVTHGVHHLEQVDHIVLMKHGEMSESGRYEDLVAHGQEFSQLISEYSVQLKRSQSGATKVDSQEIASLDGSRAGIKDSIKETTNKPVASTPSATLTDPKASKEVRPSDAAKLVEKEQLRQDSVKWSLYGIYLQAASIGYSLLVIMTLVVCQGFQVGTNLWLEYWTRHQNQYTVGVFLGIYAGLIVAYLLTYITTVSTINLVAAIRASRVLHTTLLTKVLRLPMAFFDTRPTGQLMNRFSSDMAAIDQGIPFAFVAMSIFSASVLGTLVVIGLSTTPLFLLVVPPIAGGYWLVQRYYVCCSRAVKRIQAITKSPLYSHFGETLQGVATIRAMGLQEVVTAQSDRKADTSANAFFAMAISTRWLNIRLQGLASIIILATALFAVLSRDHLPASMVGLALSYALTVTNDLSWVIKSACDLQNQMVAVERIDEYRHLNSEAPAQMDGDKDLPEHWPQAGQVVFKDYSARYREGLEPVIKHLSFQVQPGEKIGIVGRTGAGKSSLTLALFRIIEAANSHWARASSNEQSSNDASSNVVSPLSDEPQQQEQQELVLDANLERVNVVQEEDEDEMGGSIWIDGVDISTVGLCKLRQHLAIIPQEPTLFAGTLRENLDPFQELEDADLWQALERAHLKDYISTLPGGLSLKVASDGENFSVGQRSLLCLARALLRKTKILVLDEATSSVDMETDELIQRTIRTEFQDRTILTIAHRIKTIMDSDKILVLEKGELREFAAPQELLGDKESLFYRLAEQAGELKA